jgi:hypothetical protein
VWAVRQVTCRRSGGSPPRDFHPFTIDDRSRNAILAACDLADHVEGLGHGKDD